MAIAHDIPGMVFKNGAPILLARIVGVDGELITQSAISSVKYTVSMLDESDANAETPVTGHANAPLVVSDVIFNELQLDDLWEDDATGYNFRHALDTSEYEAFATAGLTYRVRYDLLTTDGQTIIIRFKLRAI